MKWYILSCLVNSANYRVHLVNTAAVKQYEGLKHTGDAKDAFWLAHLLRLGILPTGHIYPKETRPIRDLLRKRSQLVQLRTSQILSIQNLNIRNSGMSINANAVKRLTAQQLEQRFSDPDLILAMDSNRLVMLTLDEQIRRLEKRVLKKARLDPRYRYLLTLQLADNGSCRTRSCGEKEYGAEDDNVIFITTIESGLRPIPWDTPNIPVLRGIPALHWG